MAVRIVDLSGSAAFERCGRGQPLSVRQDHYLNADLKRRLVNGTFQINKLENFVAQVQQLFGVQATSLPGGVVLLS